MKKFLILSLALLALACCKKTPSVHPDWTYNSVLYEVNIRQFSPEGTFAGVEAQLPRLKDLGVDILWLMPMYEIGTEGRKGTLGSYYAISDYKAVNPEFGTMEDFEHLLAAAPPSMTSFTADQERKAEFTSIWKMTRDKVNKAFPPDAYARSRGCAGNARGYWPRCTCRACTSRAGRPRNCRWCRRPPGGRGLPRRNPRA